MKLRKEFSDADEFLREVDGVLSSGGLLAQSKSAPDSRTSVECEVVVGGKVIANLKGEAVYSGPAEKGFQVGLALQGEWNAELKKAAETVRTSHERREQWGKDSESHFHAIAKMTMQEKIQVAVKGGREERRVILKDSHYMVHPYVLKNPRLTTEEVAEIARLPSITGEMILTISNTSDWMQNNQVRLAIVKNPKTPLNVVQKHIGRCNDQDLMQMAKSENVRDGVSKLAKRTLASRGKVVK